MTLPMLSVGSSSLFLHEPLSLSNQCQVRWQTLLDLAPVFTTQTGRGWPDKFGIGVKMVTAAVRRLRVHQSIVCWGVFSGWSIFDPFLVFLVLPTNITTFCYPVDLGMYV